MSIEKKTVTIETVDVVTLEAKFVKLEEGQAKLESKIQEINKGIRGLDERLMEIHKFLSTLEHNQGDIMGRLGKVATFAEIEDKMSKIQRETMEIQGEQMEAINTKLVQLMKSMKE